MARRFDDYDPYAWVYANYRGSDYHDRLQPVLDKLLLNRLPRQSSVLDLCCGDGRIAHELCRRGYVTTGLDGSKELLRYARQRAPGARFLLRDARAFDLPTQFDAVISTFDSLNHILSAGGLAAVFRNVFKALRPGGTFVFDLNREQAYREFWAGRTWSIVDDEVVVIATGHYDAKRKLARCDITQVRRTGRRWQRSDFSLRQKYHSRVDVVAALRKAGFAVAVHDATGDLGMRGDHARGRTFFVARNRLARLASEHRDRRHRGEE